RVPVVEQHPVVPRSRGGFLDRSLGAARGPGGDCAGAVDLWSDLGDAVSNLLAVLSGVIIAGYAVAGLFFVRFWRRTSDRLFAIFGLAFWLLCIQRILLALSADAAA